MTHEEPPPGVHAMALVRWLLVALMAAVAAGSVAYSFGLLPGETAKVASEQYYCPMHPQVVQDGPGECPICSMSLVPKPAGGGKPQATPAAGPAPSSTAMDSTAPAVAHAVPGLVPVELSLDRVQRIGVRTAPALVADLVPELRSVASISADEAKVAQVHARFSGWIEQLGVRTTGEEVRKGQVLASIYNVELLPAQQEFLNALRWSTQAPPGAGAANSALPAGFEKDARARLELLGMSPAELDRIAATGKVSRTVDVVAPIAGAVMQKGATRGSFVQPGMPLFEIIDLSRVWALADIYEYDAGRVALGQSAVLSLTAFPGQRFTGRVGFIYPALDTSTRTLRVRLEFDNRQRQLRPGMYGEVTIQLARAQGVVVPRDALVATGDHQYVFVAKDAGRFEPRLVTAGARSEDKVQIIEGLAAGELVVTTANFLLDSESRLRAAVEATPHSEGQ